MTELYERELSEAFASMMDDVHPDLDAILRGAEWEGARLRRRRRTTTVSSVVATAACLGLAAAAPALLRDAPDNPEEAQVAAPSFDPLPFDFTGPDGWACEQTEDTVIGCTKGKHRVDLHWIRIPADARLPDGSIDWEQVNRLTGFQDGGLSTSAQGTWYSWLDYADEASGRAFDATQLIVGYHEKPVPQDLEFTITPPDGWACEDPADEKFGCHDTSAPIPATAQVTVVQRTSEHHAEYVGQKADGYGVSEVHNGYFVSIQPDPDANPADVQLIAAALTWDDGTPVF